jgi:hypothetical protein
MSRSALNIQRSHCAADSRTMIGVCSIALLIYLSMAASYGMFWDLAVYERAVRDLGHGLDPYRTDAGLPFVYHPLVLNGLFLLNQYVPLRFALVLLYALSFGWFCLEVGRWLRLHADEAGDSGTAMPPRAKLLSGVSSFMAALVFGGVGVTSMLSGNLTTFMHFALVAAFLTAQRTRRPFARYLPIVVIVVLSIIKPYFLLYLLIPVLLTNDRRAELLRAAGALVVFAAAWLLLAQADPQGYAAFMAALKYQSLGKSDLGYSFFATFMRVVHHTWLALAMHVAASAVLLGLAVALSMRKQASGRSMEAAFFLLYMVLTLANPRMKEYDFFPALVCFFIFLRTFSVRAGLIIFVGLAISWVPLLLSGVRAAGVTFVTLSGASNTWQIVGLAAATLTLTLTTLRVRQS